MVTRYIVDPDLKFQYAIGRAIKEVGDLRVPFTLITQSWFQSNKFIFQLKGPGKYEDLSAAYKRRKQKQAGFVYPILKSSGALEKALTQPGGDSIATTVNKTTLILGTRDRLTGRNGKAYSASWHQYGTKTMPARPMVLIGSEQTAPTALNKRRELWIQTVQNYVLQKAIDSVGGGR